MNDIYCKGILCRINKVIIFKYGPIVTIHLVALGGLNYNPSIYLLVFTTNFSK